MAFDEVRLPEDIEAGSSGGPMFRTSVLTSIGGREKRNVEWEMFRRRYDIGYGMQGPEDFEAVRDFFIAREGRGRGFRFKDWTDYVALNQTVGTGNGVLTAFQLYRQYGSYNYKVLKPVSGTVVVRVNGTPTAVTVNTTTGIITFSGAPANGAAIVADFEFDIPVRFDIDSLDMEIQWAEAAAVPSIPVIELKEPA